MKWKWRTPMVPGIAISLSAVLVEMIVLAGLVAYTQLNGDRLNRTAIYSFGVAGVGALIAIVAGIIILKQTEDQKQRLNQELLDAFLEHILDNVFFKDRDSCFVRISRAMADYCGLTNPADAINKTDADIFSSEHAGQALADEQEIIRTGQAKVGIEEKETWSDGHESWVLTTKVPLKDGRGEILGTMGVSHNITGQKLCGNRSATWRCTIP